MAALIVNPLPRPVRDSLLADRAFTERFGIRPQFTLALDKGLDVESSSLHAALRAGASGKHSAILKLADDTRVRAKLQLSKSGHVSLEFKGRCFNFKDADLLSREKVQRLRALKRVFAARPLLPVEGLAWRRVAQQRPFSDHEYVTLMSALGATPEALTEALSGPQTLNVERLVPDDAAYFDRLLAPLQSSASLDAFIASELNANRQALLERNRPRALRRIAYSALWQPLVPFEVMQAVAPDDLEPLVRAEDPFSLLFGFELCRAGVADNATFGPLGTRFLERLLTGEESKARNSIFSACATISAVHIRQATKASTAPVFWARLVALTHAGVLTHALRGLNDPTGFFEWSREHFGPQYFWHGAIDRREAPRWRPEWISPEHLHAELLGRANAALQTPGKEHCPPEWQNLIESALQELSEAKRSLATIFPGPFDDFHTAPLSEDNPFFAELEHRLKGTSKLNETEGIFSIAYAVAPAPAFLEEVLRIASAPPDQTIGGEGTENHYLELAAHIAACARSEPLAQAVINRCLYIARSRSLTILATDLFLVIVEACAAQADPKLYRDLLGESAAQLAFAQKDNQAMVQLASVIDVLCQRDSKLIPALSRARAVLYAALRAG